MTKKKTDAGMKDELAKGAVLVYQTEDGRIKLDVRLEDETVWPTQPLMAELFRTTQQNISQHILDIYEECELIEEITHKKILSVRQEGLRQVQRSPDFYNLDMIINVEDKDIERVELVPQSPTLFGQATVEGGGRLPSSKNLADPILALEARGIMGGAVSHQFMRSAGVFGFLPLSEDEYEVRVTLVPEGYYVKAILYGGIDLLQTQTRVKLTAGANTSFLNIKLTRGSAPNGADRPKPETSPIANDAGDAMLVVSQRGHGPMFTEGSLAFLKVTSADGTRLSREKRLGGEWCFVSRFNFPGSRGFRCDPTGPNGNDSLAFPLPAGDYEITGYDRPCGGNCGSLNAPTDQCKAPFTLKPGETLFVERIMAGPSCTLAISSKAP
jgi:hypothetical protein